MPSCATIEWLESRRLLSGESAVMSLGLSDANDLAWDPARHLLYVSTDRGTIDRYDPAAGAWLTPIDPDPLNSVPLRGIDVTPDGSRLYAASTLYGDKGKERDHAFIHDIDLIGGTSQTFSFQTESDEGTAWSIVALYDNSALITVDGSDATDQNVKLRRFYSVSDTFTIVDFPLSGTGGEVVERMMPGRSLDGREVYFLPADPSTGRVTRWDIPGGRGSGNALAPFLGLAPAVAPGGNAAVVNLASTGAGQLFLLEEGVRRHLRSAEKMNLGPAGYAPDGRMIYAVDYAADALVQLDSITLEPRKSVAMNTGDLTSYGPSTAT